MRICQKVTKHMQIGKQIHASAVAIENRAVVILGQAGSGKSTLMMALMARGARLIGDDQILTETQGNKVYVCPHPNAKGQFEIRGLGIFEAGFVPRAELTFVIDLDQAPMERLPQARFINHKGKQIPNFACKGVHKLEDFVYLYLKGQITPVGIDE